MRSILCASLVLAFGFVSQAEQTTSAHDEIVQPEQKPGTGAVLKVAEKYLASNYEAPSITSTIANHEQALDSIQNTKLHLRGNGAVATCESRVSDSNPKTGENQKTGGERFLGQVKRTAAVAGIAVESGGTALAGDVAASPNCLPEMKVRDQTVARPSSLLAARDLIRGWSRQARPSEWQAKEIYSRKVAGEIRSP